MSDPISDPIYCHVEGVHAREVDGEIFLVVPATGEIHHLNAVGSALWRLLQTPMRFSDAVDIFAAAFEVIPRSDIQADLAELIEQLLELELIAEN